MAVLQFFNVCHLTLSTQIFQFFALIYNKLGGTYVTLPSQVLIQYLKLIHMDVCISNQSLQPSTLTWFMTFF